MASDRFQGGLNLLGQAVPPPASPISGDAKPEAPVRTHTLLPGTLLGANAPSVEGGPQLGVPWGDFRQSIGSSIRALFTHTRGVTGAGDNFFKDSRIERRIPRQAIHCSSTIPRNVHDAAPQPRVGQFSTHLVGTDR
jgi:hypothetical protein